MVDHNQVVLEWREPGEDFDFSPSGAIRIDPVCSRGWSPLLVVRGRLAIANNVVYSEN